jgi:hypothetical protein
MNVYVVEHTYHVRLFCFPKVSEHVKDFSLKKLCNFPLVPALSERGVVSL